MSKIIITKNFIESLNKLPSKIQKKCLEFIEKFRLDSKQPSIHLEPYHEAIDKKVRSARIGDNYRAIIIAPEAGNDFILMHIDYHDEAYKWCQNKRFEAHTTAGTFQYYDVKVVEDTIESRKTDVPTHGDHKYPLDRLTDKELFEAGVPKALIPSVRAIRSDFTFNEVSNYLPSDAAQVLLGVICGLSLHDSIQETLGEFKGGLSLPSCPGDFSKFDPKTTIDIISIENTESLAAIFKEDFESWRLFLHPNQRKLVEWKVNGPMKIIGAAGTGKTVALMHRAANLAQHIDKNNEKILITTFTTNLATTIEYHIAKLLPRTSTLAGIEVKNLHRLALEILNKSGWHGTIIQNSQKKELLQSVLNQRGQNDIDISFLINEFDLVIDKAGIDTEEAYLTAVRTGRPRLDRKQRKILWPIIHILQEKILSHNLFTFNDLTRKAINILEKKKTILYRHVLVDELQDFSLNELRLISLLSPIQEGLSDPLCLVGDGHQRIYNTNPIPLSRAGIHVKGRSRRLKINYRTSEQIRNWSQNLLKGINIDDLDGGDANTTGDMSVFRGPDPTIHESSSTDTLAEYATSWIRHLLEKYKLSTNEICVTPNALFLKNALKKANIPTLELKPRMVDPGQSEPGIRFGSMKRIKGLEFRAIIMVISSNVSHTNPLNRFEQYVAATRAREWLMVLKKTTEEC